MRARRPPGFVMWIVVVAVCIAAGAPPAAAQSPLGRRAGPAGASGSETPRRWTFAVFGDTRDATRNTRTGISPLLRRIAEGITADNPALVLHIGDLVNGYWVDPRSPLRGRYDEMFENWKRAVQPLYDFAGRTGIPLYAVRGNHEDGELLTDARLKAAYRRHIASHMPQNGPENEKGLTYSVSYRGATFIAVDQYSERELGVLRGLVNQVWLEAQLARTATPFAFVFGHVPAYRVSDARAAPFPDLYDFPRHRDVFWASLRRAGISLYFCGHVHFYARVIANGIHQVVVGNGGADFVDFDPRRVDPAVTLAFPRRSVKAADMQVGYVLLTVDEAAGTVAAVQKLWNGATGRWEPGDTFTVDARRTARR